MPKVFFPESTAPFASCGCRILSQCAPYSFDLKGGIQSCYTEIIMNECGRALEMPSDQMPLNLGGSVSP